MDDIEIHRDEGESKGRYWLSVDGSEAEMTYSRLGQTAIIIDHTAVPDALRGRSTGGAMVQRAVEDARAEGRRIFPRCAFAKAQFGRHPDWQDVLRR